MKTKILIISLVTAMTASAGVLVDRGLPTANLNNSAGTARANVAWAFGGYTSANYWMVGDTFQNTSSQTWAIDTIRVWTTDPTLSAVLWGGISGSTYGVVSSTYAKSVATYDGATTYQASGGTYKTISQIDFAVNITLAAGQTYNFFFDGTGAPDGVVIPFLHASNAALSGSTQEGADNSMLYANVVNGTLDVASVGAWSSHGYGWDKASDINVQVMGSAVPEPTAVIASALLLLPFGLSSIRKLRKSHSA